MEDITVVYLTNNKLPQKWVDFHHKTLLEAVGTHPLLTFSQKPTNIGENYIQDHPTSKANIFWQMLRAAKIATTQYIAIAEDDTLYPPGYFDEKRGNVLFNQHRWSLYTWNPVYNLKNYIRTNATFIGNRELVIEALEERFAKYPMGSDMPAAMSAEIGMKNCEIDLGVTVRQAKEYKGESPVVQLDHDYFTAFNTEKETIERRHRKSLGAIQAYDIPVWGKASDLTNLFT